MAADFSFINGASRVIMVDPVANRLEYAKAKWPKVETLDVSKLKTTESVANALKEMAPRGPDVALECVAGYVHLLMSFLPVSQMANICKVSMQSAGATG